MVCVVQGQERHSHPGLPIAAESASAAAGTDHLPQPRSQLCQGQVSLSNNQSLWHCTVSWVANNARCVNRQNFCLLNASICSDSAFIWHSSFSMCTCTCNHVSAMYTLWMFCVAMSVQRCSLASLHKYPCPNLQHYVLLLLSSWQRDCC